MEREERAYIGTTVIAKYGLLLSAPNMAQYVLASEVICDFSDNRVERSVALHFSAGTLAIC